MNSDGITIDYETADRITYANLVDHKNMLKEQLDNWINGGWMHADDVVLNKERMDALNILIKYFQP